MRKCTIWSNISSLILLLLASPLVAQEATITIDGYAYGAIAGISHECPIRSNGRIEGYVGMQVACPVFAVDTQGNFTPSTISAIPGDSSRVSVRVSHVAQDTLGNFAPDTLHIVVLRQGNWKVDLYANPILFIMGYAYTRITDATYPHMEYPPITVVLGESFVLCAYEGGYEDAVAKSMARPVPCPDLGGVALPEFAVEWTLPDILGRDISPSAVPASVMAQLDGNLDGLTVRHLTHTLHPVAMYASDIRRGLR